MFTLYFFFPKKKQKQSDSIMNLHMPVTQLNSYQHVTKLTAFMPLPPSHII